jgi:hypothetical protein
MQTTSHSAFLISVVDLLTLLILAFLSVGYVHGALSAQETNVEALKRQMVAKEQAMAEKRAQIEALQQQLNDLLQRQETLRTESPKTGDQQRVQEETGKVRQEIATVHAQLTRLTEDIATLTSAIEALKQQLAAYAAREKQIQETAAVQRTHAAELEYLQQEKQRQQQRLAELQAAHARAQEKGYTLASGAPIVHQDKKARLSYFVMLTEGKIIPITPTYFTGKKVSDGVIAIWPKDKPAGLTIQQALKKDSPLMKEITTQEFRRDGRVKMLVAPDSFDTFRVLRDALAKRDIDYGWEPHEGARIYVATNGQGNDIQSQGKK